MRRKKGKSIVNIIMCLVTLPIIVFVLGYWERRLKFEEKSINVDTDLFHHQVVFVDPILMVDITNDINLQRIRSKVIEDTIERELNSF